MIEEIWKPIKGYEEYYMVSNLGRIKSLRSNKVIKPCITTRGYAQVHMSIKGKRKVKYLHRAIAEVFLGEIEEQVDHIDGNKLNNKLENLRLCTKRENQIFYKKSKLVGATYDKTYKRWKACISINGKTKNLGSYGTAEEASNAYKKFYEKHTGKPVPEEITDAK